MKIEKDRYHFIYNKFLFENTGYGFQSTNKIYTEYLAEEVSIMKCILQIEHFLNILKYNIYLIHLVQVDIF